MDPYHQPNPYGNTQETLLRANDMLSVNIGYAPPYGPPPGYGGMRPPPAPYGAGGYMPPGRPPMHPMPGAASMIHGQPGAAGTTDNGKLTTLFIGAIAPGISDAWIEKLLRVYIYLAYCLSLIPCLLTCFGYTRLAVHCDSGSV